MAPVILVLPDFNGGGAERMCLELLKRWPADWHAPIVVVKSAGGELASQFEETRASIYVAARRRSGPLSTLRLVALLSRLVRRTDYPGSPILVSFLTTLPTAAASFMFPRTVHLASLQNPTQNTGKFRFLLLKEALRRTHYILPITPGIRSEIEEVGIDTKRIRIIPNCVDTTRFEGCKTKATEQHRRARIVMLTRIHPQKRLDRAIDVFREYVRDHAVRATDLVIYGSGPTMDALARRISRENMPPHRIILAGFTENVGAVLESADCLLLTSDFEGFGNVIIEALAAGRPVVCTNVPYGPEYIIGDDVRLGRLYDTEDHSGMAAGLAEYVEEKADAAMVDARRSRAREYSADRITDYWFDVLNEAQRSAT